MPWRITRSVAQLRSTDRGSVLVLTLLLASVLALAVGAMLLNVRELARSTANKMAYEESYHAALGGVQMAKAWLMQPQLALAQLGSDGNALQAMTSGSIELTSRTAEQRRNGNDSWAETRTPDEIAAVYAIFDSTLGGGASIEGGARKVMWEINTDTVRYENDIVPVDDDPTTLSNPEGNLLTADENVRSRISKIRITTPYCAVGGSEAGSNAAGTWTRDSLLRTSLIVEAEAKTINQGVEKTRWLQQKLLIAPNIFEEDYSEVIPGVTDAPPLSPGGAIVSGAAVRIQGQSHLNVYWGPVQVKGSVELLQMPAVAINHDPLVKTITVAPSGNKFLGAGIDNGGNIGLEKWLKWQVGPNGTDPGLLEVPGGIMFPNTTDYGQPDVGQPTGYVDDFFTRFKNYQAGKDNTGGGYAAGGLNLDPGYTLTMGGTYDTAFADAPTNMYFGAPGDNGIYPLSQGAFVQRSQAVSDIVDRTINQDLNYATWKQYAIAKNGYAKWASSGKKGGGYVNAANIPLWVKSDRTLEAASVQPAGTTRFTNLAQITMKPLVPNDGNTYQIADQILFIDTEQGNPVGQANSGTPGATSSVGQAVNVTLNSSDDFFWKGLLYINGNLSTSGGGAFPSVWMKNPDEWAQDPTGTSVGRLVANCYLDGIIFTSGNLTRTGNATVYGTMVSKNGSNSGGGPDIYYNSRVRGGLFQSPQTINGTNIIVDPNNRRTISGPIRELMAWPS